MGAWLGVRAGRVPRAGHFVLRLSFMIYVYKRSPKPVQPWDVMRVGGENTIAPQVKRKFLILWNVEAVHRDGMWHYIFEFDTRDSLRMSALSQMVGGGGEKSYKSGADWKEWLGEGWEVIDEKRRWEILDQGADDPLSGEVVIHLKESPTPTPMGIRKRQGPDPRQLPRS